MTLGSEKLKIRVIISLLTILLICSVLAVFLVTINRANSRSSGENENVILEESISIREGDNEMENPTYIINVSSHEQIQRDKAEIIQILNDNYEFFCQIMENIEADPRRYICYKESGSLIIMLDYGVVEISEVDKELAMQITYIINNLGFERISESDDYVSFGKITGSHPDGGTYCQVLHCNKSVAGKNRIEERDNGSFGETVRIRDEWFYWLGINNA